MLYSAFVVDNATTDCHMLPHTIGAPCTVIINTVVDCLVSIQPTQFKWAYVQKALNRCLLSCKVPYFFVDDVCQSTL